MITSIAPSASSASPTTSNRSPSSLRRPDRISSWSSASTTRIDSSLVGRPLTSTRLAPRCRPRVHSPLRPGHRCRAMRATIDSSTPCPTRSSATSNPRPSSRTEANTSPSSSVSTKTTIRFASACSSALATASPTAAAMASDTIFGGGGAVSMTLTLIGTCAAASWWRAARSTAERTCCSRVSSARLELRKRKRRSSRSASRAVLASSGSLSEVRRSTSASVCSTVSWRTRATSSRALRSAMSASACRRSWACQPNTTPAAAKNNDVAISETT